ncbi:MAG: hypothetical protein O9301_09595 [Leptospira sp.]|nr:hypothetical protein [Leptospira sp.]
MLSLNDRKKIFLVDGLGALVSFLMLTFLVAPLELFFGMPQEIVFQLGFFAFFLAIFSLSIFAFGFWERPIFLFLVAIFNTIYCLISLYLMTVYWNQLTIYGSLYFFGEKFIVLSLVAFEFRLSFSHK